MIARPAYIYTGAQAILRPICADDLMDLYRWRQDLQEHHLLLTAKTPSSYEEYRQSVEPVIRQTLCLMVLERESESPVGLVQAYGINLVDRVCSALTYMLPEFRSQRMGVEASVAFWDYLFGCLHMRKVYFDVHEFNSGWLEALPVKEIALFEEEGHFRGHTYFRGQYWDQFRYALSLEKWVQLRDFLFTIFGFGHSVSSVSPVQTGLTVIRHPARSRVRGLQTGRRPWYVRCWTTLNTGGEGILRASWVWSPTILFSSVR